MIILADSGSTKLSWRLIGEGQVRSIETEGVNAAFASEESIRALLESRIKPLAPAASEICFFGAGVIPGEPSAKLHKVFSSLWPSARLELESDMVLAAKALFGLKRGIAGILGTGSNSCLWNGCGVECSFPAGGFLLGDEGSGNWIGRAILSDFAKGLMPEELTRFFVERYNLDYPRLVGQLYSNPHPGKYRASFALFATEHKSHPYMAELVSRGFKLFLERNVLRYPQCREENLGFAGSVAAVFSTQLESACLAEGLRSPKILRSPIDELVKLYL